MKKLICSLFNVVDKKQYELEIAVLRAAVRQTRGMTNVLRSVVIWFNEARPEPTVKDVTVQIGCHYEECAELARALGDHSVAEVLTSYANAYKRAKPMFVEKTQKAIEDVPTRIEILDALTDSVVTATGIATFAKMDMISGLCEVNHSNWSKFEDFKPVFDENGKIKKGKNYRKPDLSSFV